MLYLVLISCVPCQVKLQQNLYDCMKYQYNELESSWQTTHP